MKPGRVWRRGVVTLTLASIPVAGLSAAALGDPGSASFKVDVSPGAQTVAQGQPTTYGVSLTAKKTFSGNITLSTDLPVSSGVTATFTTNPVHLTPGSGGTSTLNLTVSMTAPTGPLNFKVIGTSASGETSKDTI